MSSVFDHFAYPAPLLGEWRHAKWYNLRLVQEALEGMQHRVSNGMTPLPSLQALVPTHREVPPAAQGSPPVRGASTSMDSAHPAMVMKSPCMAAGKAQVASATQKRGSGEGLKGICLEDSHAPKAGKRRCQAKPSAKVCPIQPHFEDTFEESDDSNELYDGPFSGSSTAAAASSTTADAPSAPQ